MHIPHQPLARHPLLQDGDVNDTINVGNEILWSNHCQSGQHKQSLRAQFNGINLGAIALVYLKFGSAICIEPSENDKYFIVQATLEGSSTTQNGNQHVNTGTGDITVIDSSLPTKIVFNPDCAHLILKIERKILETKLQNLLNRHLNESLKFDHLPAVNAASKESWFESMKFLCNFYNKPLAARAVTRIIAESHIDMVASTLLNLQRHNYFDLLNNDEFAAAPAHVRRACEFIEHNIRGKITLDALCRETCVTQRTLQNGFKKYLGQTPTEFIRNRRLHHIHEALVHAKGNTNVSRIMWEFGISNPGLWAKIYRQRYACYPSESLER